MSIFPTTSITNNIDMDTFGYSGYYNIIADCSSNSINILLTSTVYDGYTFNFPKTDSSLLNSLTLTAKTGTTINGGTSYTIFGKRSIQILSYGGDWKVLQFTLL